MATLREMESSLSDVEKAKGTVADRREASAKCEQEVVRLKSALATAEDALKDAANDLAASESLLRGIAEAAPTEEAITAAREAVEKVDKTNAAVREGITYRALLAETDELRKEYETLSDTIKQIDQDKAEKVKNADLPLDGLELTDDGIMFNGVMFGQLSTAEQIRISTLVAMAQNPELKIVLVREGALVNRANLGMMAELAASRNYQLWIEKFQEEPSDDGLHIVDGRIAFVNGVAVVAAE
jgi:hypothetical protein